MRSLALAEILHKSFHCTFIIRKPSNDLKACILAVCDHLLELEETDNIETEAKQLALSLKKGIIVLDGYHFNTQYQQILKEASLKVVSIDDMHLQHFVSDCIINHAPLIREQSYSKEPYTKLYTGLNYRLVNPVFTSTLKEKKACNSYSLFICFGGSDPYKLTLKVLHSIKDNLEGLIDRIEVVIGNVNKGKVALKKFKEINPNLSLSLHENLSPKQMAELMCKCQIAIAPASTILYELKSIGLQVISGYYTDNQLNIYKGMLKENFIHGLGDFRAFNAYGERITQLIRGEITPKQKERFKSNAATHIQAIFEELIA